MNNKDHYLIQARGQKVGRIYMGKDWQLKDIGEESNVTDQA